VFRVSGRFPIADEGASDFDAATAVANVREILLGRGVAPERLTTEFERPVGDIVDRSDEFVFIVHERPDEVA